jgi:hypothetical protein
MGIHVYIIERNTGFRHLPLMTENLKRTLSKALYGFIELHVKLWQNYIYFHLM